MAEIIKEDDAVAVCTKAGWVRWKRTQATLRAGQKTGGPDVPNARFYAASPNVVVVDGKSLEIEVIILECERWTDAKKVATVLFHGREVVAALLPAEAIRRKPVKRVQVRWGGAAPYAHVEYRYWDNATRARKEWTRL